MKNSHFILLMIVLLVGLICFTQFANGQGVQVQGAPTTTILSKGWLKSDSGIVAFPVRSTASFPSWLPNAYKTGATLLVGGVPYFYNGSIWQQLGVGAITPTDSTIFATNYRVDTAKTNLRNSIALKLNIADTAGMLTNYMKSDFSNVSGSLPQGNVVGLTSALAQKAPLTSPTFLTSINGSFLTPSEILITDGSKNIVSAPVATYPSLTELTYLKGTTSSVQTQLNAKQSTITFGTGVQAALGVNIGSAGAPVLFNGALGTPSSGTGTNLTGIPLTTGLIGGNWKTIYTDGSGVITELALGASGKVLTSNGASSAPTWETPSAGSGTDTNALKTNTPLSTTLDTVQRNGLNSSTLISTTQLSQRNNGLSVTQDTTKGISITNYTAAADGAQQISPALILTGQGWKTAATAASQTVRWIIDNLPLQGTTNPSANLQFKFSVNNGATTSPLTVSSGGLLTTLAGINAGGNVSTSGTYTSTSTSTGDKFIQNGASTATSSTTNRFIANGSLTASSGTAVDNAFVDTRTLAQTLTASGITRGFYANPSSTPADYRAFESTNTTGKSIVTGTAPSQFGGTVTIPTLILGATTITATGTEINYSSGVTSAIQTQLNTKAYTGSGNTTSGTNAASLGGASNTSSGTGSVSLGGNTSQANVNYAVVMGEQALANKIAQFSQAGGMFAAQGDAQGTRFTMGRAITGTGIAELFTDLSSSRATINTSRAWNAHIQIIATCVTQGNGTTVVGAIYGGTYNCYIKKIVNTTSLVGSVQTLGTPQSDATMSTSAVTITGNDANDCLMIQFTPPSTAGTTTVIRVVAYVSISEVGFN